MNYLYAGARFNTSYATTTAMDEMLDATGGNTGNLLIGDAVRRHLSIDKPFLLRGFRPVHVPEIEAHYDAIVIGASNFLYEGADLGYLVSIFEKINLPCIIIGLGAQSPDYGVDINIPDGTVRLMKLISERSKTLGVRGYNTAYLLNKIGIKNVRVIGCPSMYWTKKPKLEIKKKEFSTCRKVAVNGSTNVIAHSVNINSAKRVEQWLGRLSYEHNYPYILQNELYEMKILANEAYLPALVPTLKETYGLADFSRKSFLEHVRKNMYVFFDIASWMDFISEHDFAIGTRFHGNLIALLSGIPSILFAHDARTREMAEFFGMPFVDIRKVEKIDLEKIYGEADLVSLEVRYQYLYRKYVEFLNENGLEHTL